MRVSLPSAVQVTNVLAPFCVGRATQHLTDQQFVPCVTQMAIYVALNYGTRPRRAEEAPPCTDRQSQGRTHALGTFAETAVCTDRSIVNGCVGSDRLVAGCVCGQAAEGGAALHRTTGLDRLVAGCVFGQATQQLREAPLCTVRLV